MRIAIIGGGPAGLRAAEVAADRGARVTLFEAKASVGRKFLVAGRGGLNLTHTEPRELFAARYSGPGQPARFWPDALAEFDADALRRWAGGLGVETFAASTGRVFPRGLKAAPLLRRWVERLRKMGVQFALHHRWTGLEPGAPLRLCFDVKGVARTWDADAAILALGGGSWPETGSDGAWVETLAALGISVSPLQPANSGWDVPWPQAVLAAAEGRPLKNLRVRAGAREVFGELLVTKHGLEGGALYQLGPELRVLARPEIVIDFKPDLSAQRLVEKLGATSGGELLQRARTRAKIAEPALAIILAGESEAALSPAAFAARVKNCALALAAPRPLAEAISSAGGVRWEALDERGMLRRLPGVFVAGEMMDWEAPTGGYLLHGCLVTGARAAQFALGWLARRPAAGESVFPP